MELPNKWSAIYNVNENALNLTAESISCSINIRKVLDNSSSHQNLVQWMSCNNAIIEILTNLHTYSKLSMLAAPLGLKPSNFIIRIISSSLSSVLPKGRSFTASAGTWSAVLPKAVLPPQTQEPRLQFYQGLNRCDSFPLLSAPHSLFSIWTDLKRSEKFLGTPTWRWGEWIWLTGPFGLPLNSQ